MKEVANCGGLKQNQMASRYLRIITISGAVIFLIGITVEFCGSTLKRGTQTWAAGQIG